MTDADRKTLTEFLGECWHDGVCVAKALFDNPIYRCNKCGEQYLSDYRRTFSTEADLMVLYRKLFDEKRWHKFTVFAKTRFSFNDYDQVHTNIETGFYAWLLCLSGEGYEDRCQMVDDFLKEGSNVVS